MTRLIKVRCDLRCNWDRAFQLVVSDSWLAGLLRTRIIAKVAARAMNYERVRTLAFRTLSQIGIHYPKTTLSQTQAGLPTEAPKAGDRFPWVQLSCAMRRFTPRAARSW